MRRLSVAVLFALFTVGGLAVQGQEPRPGVSPGVGNAVLLATNSIQIDGGVVISSGDVVVNDAPTTPVLGEAALSLDRSARTPAGYKLAATSIDIDQGAVVGGDVYFNTLTNQGTINGSQFTPLALPVYANLPQPISRSAGTSDVIVAPSATQTLAEGEYGNLVVGRGAVVHFSGGAYAFASVTADRDSSLLFDTPANVVVAGSVVIGRAVTVSPSSSSMSAASILIQANGSPTAFDVGAAARVVANLHGAAGLLLFGSDVTADGAFFAPDIHVGRDSRFTISSARNAPPTADAQTVFTSGTSPLTITLTGSDPDGGALTFSIVSGPSAGTLSSPTQITSTSANVTYTPSAADVSDSFTFRVRDAGGATGDAAVTINPKPGDPPPPDPTTVIATDSSAQTTKDVAATLLLRGNAPAGVSLTFSIVANSGPSHGSLSALTQGSEVPQRSATVVYTPDSGYVGSDAFQFEACGVIGSTSVCDSASFSITVLEAPSDPANLVSDIQTSTVADLPVLISLGPSSFGASRRIELKPTAAVLQPATIAGNVADANNDGVGDNHNDLPGSVPVFMSAGVGLSGGGGSNGTVRMQFEFDIAQYAGTVNDLQTASVMLPTHRGTIDSLDTYFHWVSSEGDGLLTNSDFASAAEIIPGAVMPVPEQMPLGGDGTFSFGVLDQVKASMIAGHQFFVVQGRVNESLAGPARGLEVRTTADTNQSNVPSLTLTTPGITPPVVYTITTLPLYGTLFQSNTAITTVPFELSGSQVSYLPNTGFLGSDTFQFSATFGQLVDSALVNILVRLSRCDIDASACDNGR